MDDNQKHFVDELVAASLRNYGSGEPRAGLEGRILAGVQARQQAARRRRALAWGLGMAVASAMVALLVLSWPHRQPARLPAIASARPQAAAPAVAKAVHPEATSALHRPRRPVDSRPVEARQPEFPTPRPLSEQELLLVEYARAQERQPSAAAMGADRDPDRELAIAPLTIEALKIEPLPLPQGAGDSQ
jgi:hypothetical protein